VQALVVAGDAARKPIAAYPGYFDTAWKQEIQLLLAFLFVGLLWGVLFLGAQLFQLIEIKLLHDLIIRSGFALPASTLAFACALHVTNVHAGIVRGARNLLHILLSWLLLLAVVLIVGFLAALPFTGLAPLWKTSHGSEIVLFAAAVLIVLINAAYRDGGDAAAPLVLRWAGSVAALALPLLAAISAYGLALRVEQRGWTEDRIVALACIVVGACYAGGYAWAAVVSRPWLQRLEATNIATAFVILVVIAVLTTIADPARLSVADQVARLEAGRVTPDGFDFKYLRFRSARYGLEALERLKSATGPNADAIRQQATHAFALTSKYADAATPVSTEAILAAMPVYPADQKLPADFSAQLSKSPQISSAIPCLRNAQLACEAFFTADSGDGRPMIIVAELQSPKFAWVVARDAVGTWQVLGELTNGMQCDSVRQSLRAGDYRWVAPPQKDLDVGGRRVGVTPTWSWSPCK